MAEPEKDWRLVWTLLDIKARWPSTYVWITFPDSFIKKHPKTLQAHFVNIGEISKITEGEETLCERSKSIYTGPSMLSTGRNFVPDRNALWCYTENVDHDIYIFKEDVQYEAQLLPQYLS